MSEHIRALIVIVFLASLIFNYAKKPACEIISTANFKNWRNGWFAMTLAVFFSNNFWIFTFLAGLIAYFVSRKIGSRIGIFFVLLVAIPQVSSEIPGFGLANYIFELNGLRLLSLIILLPYFLFLISKKDAIPFGKLISDKFLITYLILSFILTIRGTTLTDSLREGFLYALTGVFLPYYVASRSLRQIQDFKEALLGIVIAASILAIIGIFEFARHWLLYAGVGKLLGAHYIQNYLFRAGDLRAVASTGQAIVLGYLVTIAIGFYLFIQQFFTSKLIRYLGILLLFAGLISPLSRGPWVGTALLVIIFISTGKSALKRLTLMGIAGALTLIFCTMLPGGSKVIDLLPFIGKTETGNIDYRQKLIDNSLIVIKRNPFFGDYNYRQTPELQAMIQGQGIVDVVNTYIRVALEHGFIGLMLFSGFFLSVLLGIHRSMRSILNKDSEAYTLGRSLLATLIAILVMIGTVSSISIIPVLYWTVAGIGAAYCWSIRNHELSRTSQS